jgi:hypothetical protein
MIHTSYPARNDSLMSTIAVKETNERELFSFWTENEFKIPKHLTETKITFMGSEFFPTYIGQSAPKHLPCALEVPMQPCTIY